MNGLAFSLSQFPILAGVSGQARQAIAARARERTYRAGQMIVLAGESTRSVYLVSRGRVRSQRSSTEGREVVLHDLGPGECFNLASALDGGRNLCTVTATSEAVLYVVSAPDFGRIVEDHPALALALLSHLSRRVRHLSDTAEGLALYDVRIRLARCLLSYVRGAQEAVRMQESARQQEAVRMQETMRQQEAARQKASACSLHSDWRCPPHLTQGELAAQIGTVRDVVGRTLRSFTREGLIRRERGQVVVTDLAGLRREALREQRVLAS
jgi:CRP-like cAMP-binding protein